MYKCSICGILKPRIKTDKRYGDRYVYIDGEGKTWRGSRCRDCLTRSSNADISEEMTKRKCNICEKLFKVSAWNKFSFTLIFRLRILLMINDAIFQMSFLEWKLI